MNVLVVCTGNTCRSPMAAGILKALAQRKKRAMSVKCAGLAPHLGEPVAASAITVMSEVGIDISDEYSKAVTPDLLRWANLIVAVQRNHADHLIEDFPHVASKICFLKSDVPDPWRRPLTKYREVRDILNDLLLGFIEGLGSAST